MPCRRRCLPLLPSTRPPQCIRCCRALLCRTQAERVKVFVRVRPPKEEGETPGALRIKPDGRGVVVYRE